MVSDKLTVDSSAPIATNLAWKPAAHYASPYQVVWDTRLRRRDRKAALLNWRSDEEACYWHDGDVNRIHTIELINNALRILRAERV